MSGTAVAVPVASAVRRESDAAWTQLRLAGVLLFILAAQFMTVIMLAASMAPATT